MERDITGLVTDVLSEQNSEAGAVSEEGKSKTSKKDRLAKHAAHNKKLWDTA